MNLPRPRTASEIIKRGYTDEEIAHLFELGRLLLESGELRKAEAIFLGLIEVAQDFIPALLGLAYIYIHARDYDAAINTLRSALKVDPQSPEALLYYVTCLISTGDYSTAGSQLGELSEMIDLGEIDNPSIIRFYKVQLARYTQRQ